MTEALIFASIVLSLVWAGCFVYVYKVRGAPIYHPTVIFLVYFFAGYVYRAISLVFQGQSELWEFTRVTIAPEDVVYSTIVCVVALLSFVFIPVLFIKDALGPALIPRSFLVVRMKSLYVLVLIPLVILGVMALSTAYNVGLTNFEDLAAVETLIDANGGRQLVGVSGYETAASGFLPAILVLFLFSPRRVSILAIGFIGYVLFFLWVGTPRLSFVSATVAFLVVVMIRLRIPRPKLSHSIVIVFCLLLFDIIGANRAAIKELAAGQVSFQEFTQKYAESKVGKLPLSDMAEFDSTTMVVHLVPGIAGYNYGTAYLRLFTWPIPRQWWPDKPVDTGRIVWIRYGNFVNQTNSLIGMAYSDLGMVSLVLTLGLIGIGMNILFRAARTRRSPYALVGYVVTIMFSPIIFRDGGMIFIYFIGVPMLGASLAIWLGGVRLVRDRTPLQSADAQPFGKSPAAARFGSVGR